MDVDKAPSAINYRLECNIPIIVLPDRHEGWQAAADLPAILWKLPAAARAKVLEGMLDSLAEMQRLNAHSQADGALDLRARLVVNAGVLLRQVHHQRWRAMISFSWPRTWEQLAPVVRASIISAMRDSLKALTVEQLRRDQRPVSGAECLSIRDS